jgi:hypothetical protein
MSVGKYGLSEARKALMGNPGVWAVVVPPGVTPSKRAAQDVARYIRKGMKMQGQFEAVTSGDTVYARFVGTPNNA